MNWTELLKSEIDATYKAADGLMGMVDDGSLDWKPAAGDNWMTTGQLLQHLSNACGMPCRGFLTGDWGLPEGVNMEDLPPDEMLPQADKMPAAKSVAEARRLLAEDKKLAYQTVDQAGEEKLASQPAPAPWDPTPIMLGQRMLQMVNHLGNHRNQLFYYLKLQGKPVNTMHLYGMA